MSVEADGYPLSNRLFDIFVVPHRAAMIFTTWVLSHVASNGVPQPPRTPLYHDAGLLHGSIFGVFADQLSTLASWFLKKNIKKQRFWNVLGPGPFLGDENT